MSLVSAYPSAYVSSAVDINSSVTSVGASNGSFYSHPHHHQTPSAGDYTGGQQQSLFTTTSWAWNGCNAPSVEFQQPVSLTQQQHSPPLSCYSSSAPSPDYYGYQQSQQQHLHHSYETVVSSADYHALHHQSNIPAPRVIRVVKRRNTANKKERRRTMSINNAFSELRDCIPNVPADTKLSKIKTLRLATSYISYLMAVLEAGPETDIPFRAELGRQSKSEKAAAQQQQQQLQQHQQQHFHNNVNTHQREQPKEEEPNMNVTMACPSSGDKRSKGRTGWPHHVWALELKQ
ncbi:uncharacterized protein LOC116926421 [Daphnia magna]|uniref:Uncharacterized protein n=2 Tax=Daphnia magna TaxID=35525 RepID=A0A0P5VRY9_9CRUS|nr:uncharacterized protein LOC116926421 [Daphnia magna]KAK4003449.1 hypothetical protein OUZ56_005214 [Daphnia magna]KZS11556.1 Uncharacterized protein APZ42_023690 [Daphnia magna]